jgi:hypothetical protein
VVVRRPYVFLYREERDPCERALINLATARTEFTSHADSLNVPNTFRFCTGSILPKKRVSRIKIGSEKKLFFIVGIMSKEFTYGN